MGLRELMETSEDHSSVPDEWAPLAPGSGDARALSPLAANLLLPLRVRPGDRVLELGGGTGARARALAELGAAVTVLEPDPGRAEALAAWCADLARVEVVRGGLGDVIATEPYDLVLAVLDDGGPGPDLADLVARLADRLRPGGTLALAGVGPLGHDVAPGDAAAGRGELPRHLLAAGLAHQCWLHPFPEVQLPTAVLAEEAFAGPGARWLVDRHARGPAGRGPGPEVAPAFLVLASAAPEGAATDPPGTLLWDAGDPVLPLWRRTLLVERDGDRLHLTTRRAPTAPAAERGWLRRTEVDDKAVPCGPTVAQLVIDACADGDLPRLRALLTDWRAALDRHARPAPPRSASPHPFLPLRSTAVLAADFLDTGPDRWVRGDGGELARLGVEWAALGGVGLDVTRCAGLWRLAADLVQGGTPLPWSPVVTVDELTVLLGAACAVEVAPALLLETQAALAAFRALVEGGEEHAHAAALRAQGRTARADARAAGRPQGTNPRFDQPVASAEGGLVEKLEQRLAELEGELRSAADDRRAAEERAQRAAVRSDALAAHVDRLQRVVNRMLASRRWQYGNVAGDLYGRVRGRTDGKDRRIRALLEDGDQLLRGRVAGDGPTAGGTGGRKASGAYAFGDFRQYLAHAVLDPLLRAPFTEPDRQVLGVMDYERRRRRERSAGTSSGRVSVVMATYNRAGLLPAALASVLAQTYQDWELLVVDDGSTDATRDVVRGHDDPRIRYHRQARNGGVARARNAGLAAASGEYVAYLDSDNTWAPDFLQLMVDALVQAPDHEAVYCAQELWERAPDPTTDGPRQLIGVRFAPFNRALLEHRNYIDLNAYLHRRSLLDAEGGFDERLPRLVDWDLLLRHTAIRPPLAIPCVLSHYDYGSAGDQLTHSVPWRPTLALLDAKLQPTELDLPVPADPDRRYPARPRALGSPIATPRYRRRVTVVIPSYEAAAYLDACIASVRRYTPDGWYELVVVDNASGAEVQRVLAGVEAEGAARVLHHDGNLGFTAAANTGIAAAAEGTDVVLLNNDALVTPGWLEAFWEVFDRVPDAGLVVPRQTLFPGTRTMREHVPFAKTDRELDVTLSAHHDNVRDPLLDPLRGLVELSFAPFFCVYVPREVLDEVGPLDVENAPHFRSDRLYCDVVTRHTGKRVVYTPHAKLYHFLQQATTQLRERDPEHHRRIYVDNDWASIRSAAGG